MEGLIFGILRWLSLVLKGELWVEHKKFKKGREGGGNKIVILSTSTSTQIPNHQTSKKKNDISKQNCKQAFRKGKLSKITKCLLTRSSLLQVDLQLKYAVSIPGASWNRWVMMTFHCRPI